MRHTATGSVSREPPQRVSVTTPLFWREEDMGKYLASAVFVFALILGIMPALQAHELLELKAANYNPFTGVWRDSSGNGNDAIGLVSPPSFTHGQTPNGSAVATFDGTNFLYLTQGISATGFTCFAY